MESVNIMDVKLYNSSHYGDLEGVVDALAQGGRVSVRNPKDASSSSKWSHRHVSSPAGKR